MIVFRVENQEGDGPFQSGGAVLYQQRTYGKDTYKDCRYPPYKGRCPQDEIWQRKLPDIALGYSENHVYGCSSLEQLSTIWFPGIPGRMAMREMGYRLVAFFIDEKWVWQGSQQVLFKKNEAEETVVLDLVEALKKPVYKRLDLQYRDLQQMEKHTCATTFTAQLPSFQQTTPLSLMG